MTTINTTDSNVYSYTMTVEEAASLLEADPEYVSSDLQTVLDSAQFSVKNKETLKAFVLIEIIPDQPSADTDPAA